MRIKNKGVKALNRDYYGDLLITIKAEYPKKLDKNIKAEIEQLAKDVDESAYAKYTNYLKKLG